MTRCLPLYLLGTFIFAYFSLQPAVSGYEDDDFAPLKAWRQGYSCSDKGEQNKAKGNNAEALRWFRKALNYYEAVSRARPDWNQNIIGKRIKYCRQEINSLLSCTAPSPTLKNNTSSEYSSKSSVSSSALNELSSENEDLKTELKKYKAKLFSTMVDLDDTRRELKQKADSADQIENMMREKRLLNHKYNLLLEKYESLQTRLSEPDSEKTRLKNQLLEEKMQADIINQRLKMQKRKENELRSEMAELYRLKTAQKMKLQQLKNSLKSAQRRVNTFKKQLSVAAIEKLGLTDTVNQTKTRVEQALKRLAQKDAELEKLNNWLLELREKGGNQSKLNKEIAERSRIISNKYDKLQKEYDELAGHKQALADKLRSANMEYVQIKKTMQNIDQQKKLLFQDYQLLQKKYYELELCEQSNAKELGQTRDKNSKLEAQINLLSKRYDKLKGRLNRRMSSEYQNILDLKSKNRKLLKEIERDKIAYGQISEKCRNKEKSINRLTVKLESIKKDFRALSLQNKVLMEDKLKLKEISQTCLELQQKNKAYQNDRKVIDSLKSEKDHLLNRLQEVAILKKQIMGLEKQNQALSDDCSNLKMSMNDFLKLREQLRSAKESITGLRRLQQVNTSLNKDLSKQTEKCALLEEKLKLVTARQPDLVKLQAENAGLSTTIQVLNKQLDALKKQQTDLLKQKNSNIDLKARLAALVAENAENEQQCRLALKQQQLLKDEIKTNCAVIAEKDRIMQLMQNQIRLQGNKLVMLNQLRKNNALLEEKIERLTAQNRILAAKQLNKRKLVNQFKAMNNNYAGLEKKYKDTVDQLTALKSDKAEKLKRFEQLTSELDRLRKAGNKNMKKFGAEVTALENVSKHKDQRITALLENIKDLNRTIHNNEKTKNELVLKVKAEYRMDIDRLENAKLKLKKRLIDLNGIADKTAINLTALENRNKLLVSRLEKLSNRNKYLENKNKQLAEKVPEQHVVNAATPSQLKKLLDSGIKAEHSGSEDVAIWHYRKYLETNPKNAEVNRRLGTILIGREQLTEAAALLQRAYLLNPDEQNTALNYGRILLMQNKPGNACAVLEKAIRHHPDNYALLVELAKALVKTGSSREAAKLLNTAVKLQPEKPGAYLELAKVQLNSNQRKLAVRHYRKARELGAVPDPLLEEKLKKQLDDNSEMTAFLNKAATEAETGNDWVSAAWYFNQLLQLNPDNRLFRLKLAATQLIQKQFKSASKTIAPLKSTYCGAIIFSAAQAGSCDFAAANTWISKGLNLPKDHKINALKPLLEVYIKRSRQKGSAVKLKQYLSRLEKVI
ncbi:tetratricopeptide repeat protein [Lentisphaerota bacterium ZTH]|nr:tetratricopeptide repeat protein [Lentisphaerota bacterium]WET07676.1 tetratricopeptide repeat protein [Lentisphaerota bacterium ZTH]